MLIYHKEILPLRQNYHQEIKLSDPGVANW